MRGRSGGLVFLVGIGIGLSGCGVVSRPVEPEGAGAGVVGSANVTAGPGGGVAEEDRVRDLEQLLAERDREIAAARAELSALRQEEITRPGTAGTEPGVDGAPEPSSPETTESPSPLALTSTVSSAELRSAQTEADRASRQLASVQAQLSRERRRRKVLERDLQSLREETSAGPFERQQEFVLRQAQARIAELERALEDERDQREELARRYDALQAEARLAEDSRRDGSGPSEEQLARLQAEQEEALADLRRELAESRRREEELRATIVSEDGSGAAALASSVSTLEAQNSDLEARLEEERRRNEELASKLKTALRVTDLIFKMKGQAAAESTP